MSRYTLETVKWCVNVLSASRTFSDALASIQQGYPSLNGDNLCKAFKRHGFNAPRTYLGSSLPPAPRESGASAFVYPESRVAQPAQQSRAGQHAYTSAEVKASCPERGTRLRTILAVPDIHAPFHDELAVNTCVAAVAALQPDHLVFLGDICDSYDISDFTKDPGRRHRYKEEIESANEVLDRFDRLRVADVRVCRGNHDDRIEKFIAKRAPELYGMISIDEELGIKRRGWTSVPYGEVTTIGKFHFSHEFGSCGKYAAATALAGVRHCIIFGHTHRAQCEYGGLADGERHVAWSAGWLGDYEALAFSYKKKWQARREWTHGFMWITLDETGCGWASFIPIIDGRCVVDGRVISGRKEAA